MKKPKSEKSLIEKIDRLKTSAIEHRSNCAPGQRRYWMYDYLKDVYAVFLDFETRGRSKKAARRIIKILRLPINDKSHLLRVLIEASSDPEDNRTKIKWANALRYAFGWLQKPERLKWFFGVNGGIAGSAAKFAVLRAGRRQKKLEDQRNSSDGSTAQSASVPPLPA